MDVCGGNKSNSKYTLKIQNRLILGISVVSVTSVDENEGKYFSIIKKNVHF